MLKNESSYKSLAKTELKLSYLKAQKMPIFAMKRSATQKFAVSKGLMNWHWHVIMLSKSWFLAIATITILENQKDFWYIPLNRFFGFLMNLVHMIPMKWNQQWKSYSTLKPYLGLMERFSGWIKFDNLLGIYNDCSTVNCSFLGLLDLT